MASRLLAGGLVVRTRLMVIRHHERGLTAHRPEQALFLMVIFIGVPARCPWDGSRASCPCGDDDRTGIAIALSQLPTITGYAVAGAHAVRHLQMLAALDDRERR